MGHKYHSLSIDATIMVSKHCPITGEHVGVIFVTQWVIIATLWPAKNALNFSSKRLHFKNDTVNFLNFAKSCILSCSSKLYNNKKFTVSFLKCKRLELKLRVFLAGQSLAMITHCVTKITPTCSPVIGQCFETMIVASIDKEWYLWPIKI